MPNSLPKLPTTSERLAFGMNRVGLTVLQLCIESEISPASLHYWLDDGQMIDSFKTAAPTVGDWLALSHVLRLPVEWLSDGKVKPEPHEWSGLEISGLLPFTLVVGQLVTTHLPSGEKIYLKVKDFEADADGNLLVHGQSVMYSDLSVLVLPTSQITPFLE